MNSMIQFTKAHGTGNDFVVVADFDDELDVSPAAVRRICHRNFGIGADAFIRITRNDIAPFYMDYRNADGSLAEMCGNGVRVVGKWLGDRGLARDTIDIATLGGIKQLDLHRKDRVVDTVSVDMGQPEFGAAVTEDLVIGDQRFTISSVSMGNPHAVMFVDDVDAVPLEIVGPLIQSQSERFPSGINVEVAAVQADRSIDERTFERGVGETLACGTGASAVAVVAQRRGLVGEDVLMRVRGGELLLNWKQGKPVIMTGPAVEVFQGEFDAALLTDQNDGTSV